MISGQQELPTATVIPVAGFVIKARTATQSKIFINIVGHNLVEAPHAKTLVDVNNQQGIRIPLAVGEPALVKDNSGADCEAIDVMINEVILKDTEQDAELKHMVVEIAIQAVGSKYKLQIDEKSVTIPKLKYKGEKIRPQRIRVKKESSIEEVVDETNSVVSTPEPVKEVKRRIPIFTVSYIRGDDVMDGLLLPCYRSVTDTVANNLKTKAFTEGPSPQDEDIDELILGHVCHIDITMCELTSRRTVQLEVNDDCLKIDFIGVANTYDPFVIWFPTDFLSSKGEASWADKTLKIRIPVN